MKLINNYTIYLIALPIILILVFGEYFYSKKKQDGKISIKCISSNLLCGLIDRVFFVFFSIVQFELLKFLNEFLPYEFSMGSIFQWVLLLFTVDFLWYWYHRYAHSRIIAWLIHSTHHQTEEFGFSLGLRVSFLQLIVRTVFWIPLAFIGFPAEAALLVIFAQSFYQFFIHTELYDYPKWISKVLVSPSFHYTHHSSVLENSKSNYGGMFVFWDKLFNTYKRPISSEVKPKRSENYYLPYNAYFRDLFDYILLPIKNYKIKDKWSPSASISGQRMLVIFLLSIIPSLLLITFRDQFDIKSLVLISLGFIILLFTLSGLIPQRKSDKK